MASNIVLSEEQVQCPICLDVFRDPVSTPCGHNFCKACITSYWDSSALCQCPMCKDRFTIRPELRINTFIAEMVAQMKKLSPVEGTSPSSERPQAEPVAVPCDVCPGEKLKALKALKSCLVCLASYCQTHLEPHQRVAALKRHKLIDPVENLEDRVCKKHDTLMKFFCRTEQMCVCQFCTEGDHRTHSTVPLEEEFVRRKAQLGKMKGDIQETIQERQQKIKEVKQSAELRRREAEREIADSVQTFTALVRSIERSQEELTEVIEENQRAAEKQAEGFIKDLEQEVTELQRRSTELEKLSHTEDHLHLLHSCPSLSTPPPTKDWSQISISSELAVESVMRAVAQLEKTLNEEMDKLKDIKFKRIQQLFAVDVTLDPDTAHTSLILSKDGKQVRWENFVQNLPNNPGRFDVHTCVLGKEGFSSGRFYYEVQVKGKTGWVLGVVRGSIKRKGTLVRSPKNGHWSFGLWYDDGYKAFAGPDVVLSLKQKPQKVGVFVDYERGEVSFYDVEIRSLLYSFTGCRFNDTLYPCFSTCPNRDGKNAAPLVMCPVSHTGLTL